MSSSVPVARKRNAVLISLLVIGVIIVGASLIAIETNSSVASFAQGLVGESNYSIERPGSRVAPESASAETATAFQDASTNRALSSLESTEQEILRNNRFVESVVGENLQVPSTSGHLEQTQAIIKAQIEYNQELYYMLIGKDK